MSREKTWNITSRQNGCSCQWKYHTKEWLYWKGNPKEKYAKAQTDRCVSQWFCSRGGKNPYWATDAVVTEYLRFGKCALRFKYSFPAENNCLIHWCTQKEAICRRVGFRNTAETKWKMMSRACRNEETMPDWLFLLMGNTGSPLDVHRFLENK